MIEAQLQPDTRLPRAVYDLGVRLGANTKAGASIVRLKQIGRMKSKLDAASWLSFSATQTISTRVCAFDWRARFGPLGAVSVRDALVDGEGRLDVTALGFIPLSSAARSPALTRGELMRYLAELAFAPDAILHNANLRWREDGQDALAVRVGTGDTESEVVLSLDSDGRIAGTYAPDRPRSTTAPFLPTPWRGRFSDYRWHDKRWLPFAGEVSWEVEGKEIVYWQGRIEHWEMEEQATAQGSG